MVYFFGGYEIDDALFEVRRSGERISVSPRVFDAMLFLIRNQHRVVTKHELLQVVWAGVLVSDDALNQAIRKARRLLGGHQAIQTVRGRGYRFTGGASIAPPAQPDAMA